MDPEQWQAFIASLPAAARARVAANIVANQHAPAPAVAAETARTAGPSPVRSIGEMIAKSAGDAFTLPGRALYGEIPRADEMPQDEAVGEALNFAGMVSTPALRGARAPNTLSMSGASDGVTVKRGNGGIYDVHVGDEKAGTISLAKDGNARFVSLAMIEPKFQGKGTAKAAYDAIESEIGARLFPSPLGLSEPAKKFWIKRLGSMPYEDAAALMDEAVQSGLGYGLKGERLKNTMNELKRGARDYRDAHRYDDGN